GNLKTILSKIFDITERKGLEEKITESEKRYRTIFENAGDGILILDSDKRIISVNESFARMHGYTVAELLTMQLKDLDTKESYERSDELLSKASDGSHFTFEISHYSKKGEVITLEVNSKPLVIKNKHCFVAFHRDITERKQLLGELKGSEEYFRSLFEKNPTASCIIEPDARISKVNSRFCELTGYTRKEVIGKSWIRLIHDDDKERLIAYRQNRFSGKKDVPDGYEFKYCRKDGVVKIGLISIVLLTDNNILASFIDITNLKQLEKELKLNEEYFRTIFENNSVAIAIIEPDSTISMVNNKFSEILDYTKDEICGTIWTKYVFRDDLGYLEQFPQSNDPDMAAQPYSFEFRFVRKHGEIRQALINAVVLSNMKTIASVLDITERKEMELELVYAKEKAQESDRLKSAFLSNMSHEIRTPMNGILGFSELLKEPNLSHEEQQNFINTIVNSGERLLNTINAIIDISKIESGMTGVDLRETNINDKLDFTYTFFRRETDEKGLVLYLNKRLPAEESFVSTDNEKVYSILANLVKNAIKFTKEGSVEFGCERIDNYLRFFVKDTGPGIPENHKEFIFERFRQGSESHDRGYEGSGLGLSISKNYVEMLGGQIWFESEVNKGTTFYFTVPSKSVSETKMGTKDISKIGENNVQEGKLKILITEDDEVSYSLLIRMLQGISLKIFHAVNGAEAIQHCHENPDLDLILMDIRMPEM
ncbi:MAG TPA: PAS domain S-box protein, partial [Ignavibacteriaceae bacterium]|nr:PAS domain S-box protein [Ignavibacteriaceae bacterium]